MTRRFQFSLRRIFASVTFAAIACGLFRISPSLMQGPFYLPVVGWLIRLCGIAFIGASVGTLWRNTPQGVIAVALVLVALATGAIFSQLW